MWSRTRLFRRHRHGAPQTLPDGNRIKQSSTVSFYRDSEGRTRREQSLQNLNGLAGSASLSQVAFINDPVGRGELRAQPGEANCDQDRIAGRLWPWVGGGTPTDGQSTETPRAMAGGPHPGGRGRTNPNLRTESLGRQIVEGVQADGTRTTLTIPAGEIGNENPIQVITETLVFPRPTDLRTAKALGPALR